MTKGRDDASLPGWLWMDRRSARFAAGSTQSQSKAPIPTGHGKESYTVGAGDREEDIPVAEPRDRGVPGEPGAHNRGRELDAQHGGQIRAAAEAPLYPDLVPCHPPFPPPSLDRTTRLLAHRPRRRR